MTAVQPSIVYLLGYPGVGKYTVGSALARRTGAVLIDSQVINQPILQLFDWAGSRPSHLRWYSIGEARYRTI